MNRGVAAARSAAVSPTLAVIFLVVLLFACNKLAVALSVYKSSPVVLSGSLAIQVFKRPKEWIRGLLADLEGEKLL